MGIFLFSTSKST
ncbi:hypothetical protein RJ641_030260 [Dillenia turbinata]|uniref:Uncharacterized protein n=1 Tax=Dillenia turbinata TaxID=194707 RepID=A0AAN8VZT6_9MAGN